MGLITAIFVVVSILLEAALIGLLLLSSSVRDWVGVGITLAAIGLLTTILTMGWQDWLRPSSPDGE